MVRQTSERLWYRTDNYFNYVLQYDYYFQVSIPDRISVCTPLKIIRSFSSQMKRCGRLDPLIICETMFVCVCDTVLASAYESTVCVCITNGNITASILPSGAQASLCASFLHPPLCTASLSALHSKQHFSVCVPSGQTRVFQQLKSAKIFQQSQLHHSVSD